MGIPQRVVGKIRRTASGLVGPKPYDPRHPEPAAREIPPAAARQRARRAEWSAKSGGTIAGSDVAAQIRAYASACSVNAGDGLDFQSPSTSRKTFVVEVWRVGRATSGS